MSEKQLSNIIKCPHCQGENLHHYSVEIFDREEDAKTGRHVVVKHTPIGSDADEFDDHIHIDVDISENPSIRRDGVSIRLVCENCKRHSTIDIVQHKGMTLCDVNKHAKPSQYTIDQILEKCRD